jgi:hypothetical protein
MAGVIDGFLNNRNGKFPEFVEAVKMGRSRAGRGVQPRIPPVFIGKGHSRAPSLSVSPGRVAVATRLDGKNCAPQIATIRLV